MPFFAPFLLFFLLLAVGPGFGSTAWALELIPFNTTNQNPLVAVYGLPPAGPAAVLAPGRISAELRADIASNFTRARGSQEQILLDGETYRYTLALKHGIGDRLEVGLEVPYVMHRDGFLDSFVNDFHDTFGLPDGGRDDAPSNRLAYTYERDGLPLIDMTEEKEGFGELRLTGAWQLWRREGEKPRALALRASLKLPTGDEDRLLGSGSTDFALWLSGSRSFRGGSLALFGAAGGLLMTDGDVLPDQQRNAVAFGTLGGGWLPLPRLALKLQFDGHTPFYRDSGLRELGESVQLVLGGTIGVTDTLSLDIAISEDIVVDSASDAVFHFALKQTF